MTDTFATAAVADQDAALARSHAGDRPARCTAAANLGRALVAAGRDPLPAVGVDVDGWVIDPAYAGFAPAPDVPVMVANVLLDGCDDLLMDQLGERWRPVDQSYGQLCASFTRWLTARRLPRDTATRVRTAAPLVLAAAATAALAYYPFTAAEAAAAALLPLPADPNLLPFAPTHLHRFGGPVQVGYAPASWAAMATGDVAAAAAAALLVERWLADTRLP